LRIACPSSALKRFVNEGIPYVHDVFFQGLPSSSAFYLPMKLDDQEYCCKQVTMLKSKAALRSRR
jgi:hypothetical protein